MDMPVTAQNVAEQLGAYLRHEKSLHDLVDWSERQIMDGQFASSTAGDVVARLGLADVRAFGLTWEDAERMLRALGFAAHLDIVAV